MTWRHTIRDGPPESGGTYTCVILRQDGHLIVGMMDWDGTNFIPSLGDFSGGEAVVYYHPIPSIPVVTIQ